jgi:hypothetical protein
VNKRAVDAAAATPAGPQPGPGRFHQGAAAARGGGGRGGGSSRKFTSVTPTARAVGLREHVSLVKLPDNGFKPRCGDPRGEYGGLSFVDYSVPIGERCRCATSSSSPEKDQARR